MRTLGRAVRWWLRPAKHADLWVTLETDPLFWVVLAVAVFVVVSLVVPVVLNVHTING